MRHTGLTALIILLLCYSVQANATQTLRLLSGEHPPYMTAKRPDGGILSNIIQTAFARAGYAISIEFISSRRGIAWASSGKYDGLMVAYYWPGRESDFTFSEPILAVKDVLVTLKSHPIKLSDPVDLSAYRVGVFRLAKGAIAKRYPSREVLQLSVVDSYEQTLKMLLLGRVDAVLAPQLVMQTLIDSDFAQQREELLLTELPSPSTVHTAISNKVENHQKIIADFNRELKKLQQEGAIAKALGVNSAPSE